MDRTYTIEYKDLSEEPCLVEETGIKTEEELRTRLKVLGEVDLVEIIRVIPGETVYSAK